MSQRATKLRAQQTKFARTNHAQAKHKRKSLNEYLHEFRDLGGLMLNKYNPPIFLNKNRCLMTPFLLRKIPPLTRGNAPFLPLTGIYQ